MQAAMSAMQPAMGMFQTPMQAFQGLSGLPQSMMGSFGGMFGGMKAGEVAVPPADLVKANASGSSAFGGASGGGGGAAGGGFPGAGLTSYTRPTSGFAPETAGRPAAFRPGSLSGAELQGPTSTQGGAAVPVAPAGAGMLGHGKDESSKREVAHARIALSEEFRSGGRLS